jgi:hypothetical protein
MLHRLADKHVPLSWLEIVILMAPVDLANLNFTAG